MERPKHFNNQFRIGFCGNSSSRSEVSSMPPSTAPKTNILRRFRRNRRGSAAVEFALVAPIFFAVLFAIIELALVFFASQILETVTQDTARLIMTGQAQNAAFTQAQFKNAVCAKLTVMFDCVNGVSIDVQSYTTFATVDISNPIDAAKNFVPPNNYLPGGPTDIVVVRLFYQWPVFVTGLGFNLASLSGNKRLLTATAAFQNEPY
jgi:Flp pilus assembly protein TadG